MSGHEEQKRQVILVGKTGNGKSSTGNSILGEDVFESKNGLRSVTQTCQQYSRVRSDVQRRYTVVDTPGLFDTDNPIAERALEIQRALEICPKPHAFLIILRPDTRYTEEEKLTIDMLRVIYGELFLKHAILVFTRGNDYASDQELNEVIAESVTVMTLKTECGSRVARVENNPRIDSIIREELTSNVLDLIERVSDGGKKVYLYRSLAVHRNCLEQHLENRTPNADLGEELKVLVEEIRSQLEDQRSTIQLKAALVDPAGMALTGLLVYSVTISCTTSVIIGNASKAPDALAAAGRHATDAVVLELPAKGLENLARVFIPRS